MRGGSSRDPAKDVTRTELARIAADYADLVRSVRPDELTEPTTGTRWTNRQLLFHMLFGQIIAWRVLGIIGLFSHLPPGVSRAFSRVLIALTGPYDWINWFGAVIGGRLFSPAAMARWMDSLTDALLRWYDRADQVTLARGMTVPQSWDPYFTPWMSRADVLAWAPKHYWHHRRQLTIAAAREG